MPGSAFKPLSKGLGVCLYQKLYALSIMVSFSYPQSKSMIYEQEIYNQFTYKNDRPYFHSFPGDVSMPCLHDLCQLTLDLESIPQLLVLLWVMENSSQLVLE